jgi:hypothetical protein
MGAEWGRLPPRLFLADALSLAAALLVCGPLLSCAGSAPKKPTVLSSMEEEVAGEEPERAPISTDGPIHLPHRPPARGGTGYRIVLEVSGDWFVQTPGDPRNKPPLTESHLLELEYREIPTEQTGDGRDAYVLGLDALHYKLLQKNPPALREIELGNDRLRTRADGEEVMDLQGAQPKGDLTPQKLLGRIFGVLVHDEFGNPLAIAPRGLPVAREFLERLQIKPAILYSRFSLPQEEIEPGAIWHAKRFPASRSGALGLALDIEYSLVGFEEFEGVPCALIQLRASKEGEKVPSVAGFEFDRVAAKMSGTAWVELETSRVRRLVIEDEVRVSLQRGQAPLIQSTRMRHATRMLFELRDLNERGKTWADGTARFGIR